MQNKQQKISPIKQRILEFADTLGISKREFYRTIEVSRGTLESTSGITEDVLARFIDAYPQISPDWLLTGRGKVFRKEETVLKTEDKLPTASDVKGVYAVDNNVATRETIRISEENKYLKKREADLVAENELLLEEMRLKNDLIDAFRKGDISYTAKVINFLKEEE